MGLDGLSMGSVGLSTEMTSAQMANQAEQLALKESEIKIKNVDESADEHGIKRKEENSEDEEFNDGFNKKKKKDDSEDSYDENLKDETPSLLSEKDFDFKDSKEFSIRMNSKTEMVELFNNKEEKILETISAKDLMGLLAKLDSASGILVNRKI